MSLTFFYDFCIPYDHNIQKIKKIIKACIQFGYKTIAIEQKYNYIKTDSNKKSNDIFPTPINLSAFSEFQNQITILQRLTIQYSDTDISYFMTSSNNIRKYNLIAGLPKTEAALNHCCTLFSGDIISFDPEDKYFVKKKAYQVAVKREMYFEIKYASFIECSDYRKDMIKIVHNYHSKGKSRNIIISSGATDAFNIRGSHDIINFFVRALIMGLSEGQGKSSISSNCRKLYLKSESRRLGKTVMLIKHLDPLISSSTESETNEEIYNFDCTETNEISRMNKSGQFKRKRLH